MSKIENSIEWKDIDWKNVQSYVSKLQTQIYQASKSGNAVKMRKLQHTLARSYRARLLAVRKVTQDNQGKRTAGVDRKASILPQERLELAEKLRLDGKAKPVRRVQIPKSNGKIRNLGIPTIEDRAKQCLAKFVFEPEWRCKILRVILWFSSRKKLSRCNTGYIPKSKAKWTPSNNPGRRS